MNYYEHHLGDYDGATAHLSWLEDCAYRRMLGLYYRTEAPLPADPKQVCRLVRAVSKPERDAVHQVLHEFFELADDGWHNARCDEDIAAFHELEPEREAKRENAKERQRRARVRRAELFEALRGHNIVPPYDTPTKALETLLSRVTAPQQVTEPVTPVTRDNTATHTHLPLPTTQLPVPKPVVKTNSTSYEVESPRPAAKAPASPGQLSLVEDPPAPPSDEPYAPPDCPHHAVLELWAEVLPAMPQHTRAMWRGTRADHLRARWRETAVDKRWPDQAAGLQYLRKLFAYCAKSPFLAGQTRPQQNRRPFVLELEWLVAPTNWARVIEGKYHEQDAA